MANQDAQDPHAFPLRVAARATCRLCLSVKGMAELPHVERRIDECLDTFSGMWTVQCACRSGKSARALEYLAARFPRQTWPLAARFAAENDHVHVLQWLNEHHADRCDWTGSMMDTAARNGQLAVVQWLHWHRHEGCTQAAMDDAAMNGHLEVVRFLHFNRREGCTTRAMDLAAANGYLEVVKFLHSHRYEGCTAEALKRTVVSGDLSAVQWLVEHRPREGNTGRALVAAARLGHLRIVQWLHGARREARRDYFVRMAIQQATKKRHTAVVQWLQVQAARSPRRRRS